MSKISKILQGKYSTLVRFNATFVAVSLKDYSINLVLEDIVIECNVTRNVASLVIIEKYCKELSRMISQKKDLSKDIV